METVTALLIFLLATNLLGFLIDIREECGYTWDKIDGVPGTRNKKIRTTYKYSPDEKYDLSPRDARIP